MNLRIREIRPYGSPSRFMNLDLGREQGTGRGEALAGFCRETADHKFECFTFVPDTLHNRVTLLVKNTIEVAVCFYNAAGKMIWKKLTWKDVEDATAPAIEVEEAEAPVTNPVPGFPTPDESPVEVPGEGAADPEITGMEDFLILSKRQQLTAVKDDKFPIEALKEVIESTDPRLSEQAREAAAKKAERLTVNAG